MLTTVIMIIVRLKGGLGNQMFQYATGMRLAQRHNTDLKIDLTWFINKKDDVRKYSLNSFRIEELFADSSDLFKFPRLPISKTHELFLRMYQSVKSLTPYSIVMENQLAFDPRIMSLPDNVVLIGYWQSYKYFEDIREIILKWYQPSKPLSRKNRKLLDHIEKTCSIGIHVRRGDYQTNRSTHRVHGCCSLEYYQKSIEYIASRVDRPYFFVFSDDISWARHHLSTAHKVDYISHNGPEEGWADMMMMSCCKHNIIANSSFSWWAAWLNQRKSKIVIGPVKYYSKRSLNKHTKDLFPPDWVRI